MGRMERMNSMKRIETVAIVGMGALGLLYGTYILDRKGPSGVCYVMDEERVRKYRGKPFYKNGAAYQLPVCGCREAKPVDLVIVAVKYTGLEAAIEEISGCVGEQTIILSVLNGITSEDMIAKRYGREHLIDTVAQGMDAMKFGDQLTYTRMGELRIGVREECQRENLEAVKAYFDEIAMPYTIDEDIIHRMWGKFMLNVGINQTCMVYETNYRGCLEPGEANRTMIAAMREVIAVGQEEGIRLGEQDLNEYVAILRTLAPDGMPSMRQDGVARRYSEVEMFAGTVISLAQKHQIYVPANQFLYDRVREMESSYAQEEKKP